MNFICKPCKEAATATEETGAFLLTVKRFYHDKCKGGTWCDCQHRVGRKNV